MKSTQTFTLGRGTLTLPNGKTYPCSSFIIEKEYPEIVDDKGVVVHLGPPTLNIKLEAPDGPEPEPARRADPAPRTGACFP